MDHVTGGMMGIYDDKVEQIDLKGQLKPFNINQLDDRYRVPKYSLIQC